MTKLLVSFDKYQNNWYVGELYESFYNYLKSIPNLDVEYKNIKDLSLEYPKIENQYLSIFSIYNLIIINKQTNKTFIHSLSDYAPSMMDDISGIIYFDVAAFSCTSNLTQEIYNRYSPKYKIIPSFYILENYDDINLIEKHNNQSLKNDKVYFNGLCYGDRGRFKEVLLNNEYFHFNDKRNPNEYRTKNEYYKELSNYKFGLSLNGAAKICYRDIEYFGMGILTLRENLDVLTKNPIIDGVHYITFLDDEIKTILYDVEKTNLLTKKMNDKFNSIINKDYSHIIHNAKNWYLENCTPDNQIIMLKSFLLECGVL
jgi:hypothetical protein